MAVEGFTASGRARLVAGLVMASFAGVYALGAPARTDGAPRVAVAVVLVAAVLVLHLVWLVPRIPGNRWAAVAAQAACAYGAVALGTSVGVLGFVAGSLMLAAAWPVAVAVLASAAVLDAPRGGSTADATLSALLVGLVVYGLVRLADRVDDTAAARLPLTMAAVSRERLRIATELDRGLGEGLATISAGSRRALDRPERIGGVLDVARRSLNDARAAAAGFRSMSLAPEVAAARALLEAAGVEAEVRSGHREPLGPAGALLATVLREAVTDVVRGDSAERCVIETSESRGVVRLRVVNDGVRTAAEGEEGLAAAAERVRAAGGTFATGLGDDGRFTVEAAVRAAKRPVTTPDRNAYRLSVTLLAAVLAGFALKGLLQAPSGLWLGLAGFLVGGLLVALPRRFAVPLVAAVITGVGAAAAGPFRGDVPPQETGPDVAATVNSMISTLVTGLVLYGLVRLTRLVRDLRVAGEELARAATVQERLRAARDLHDLLGHSLAAILLKCELARRLAAADPARARAELTEVVAMAERAREDLRAATGGTSALVLDAEVASARSVLAAAGVEVEVDTGHAGLTAEASAVLSVVLREAVTNVLRHSAARHCAIVTARDGAGVRLTVRNDGLDPRARRTPPGAGIGNLTTRLASHNGTLSARADGNGGFRLDAHLPA
ncbi:sensor histidine kinase [Actinomadura litoris]|uniref:sensor histidine kinase n=1 Tax=Actinomadura litoris TaxID=2678616 RepID=UPI001FA7D557|nr:histidine kinase [Actinomadura litoris]